MEHGRRIEDRAARFAEAALAEPAQDREEQARRVAHYMVAFLRYEQQRAGTKDTDLEYALKRIEDPVAALPSVVEKVGQAYQLLRDETPGPETTYLSRTMLADALKSLGRSDLVS